MRTTRFLPVLALAALPGVAAAQMRPGHSIGKVNVIGKLIHIELAPGALLPERLFDLDHRTLRFTPDGAGYRVENVALKWDSDVGTDAAAGAKTLAFKFPFSGKQWDTVNVSTGSITFGARPAAAGGRGGAGAGAAAGRGGRGGGFPLERYSELRTAGGTFINSVPGIAAFVRISNNGPVTHFKSLPDRAVVTWDVGETIGGTQAFTWVPVHNNYQAVLYKDGVIELSYNGMNAKDGIVGVYPMVTSNAEKSLGALSDGDDASAQPNLDIKSVKLSSVDGLFLKATIETRGPVLPNGDASINGLVYRIGINKATAAADPGKSTVVWTIRGTAGRGRGNTGPRYTASGPGIQPEVVVSGNTISIEGVVPEEVGSASAIAVSADAGTVQDFYGAPVKVADAVPAKQINLSGLHTPQVDLSTTAKSQGPFPVLYESFHYMPQPLAQDVTCTVINALGDNFDLLASYSTFRVDNPEGGTPSTGPYGGAGYAVQGIGSHASGAENYCSKGRFQWQYDEPVSTSAIQIQEKAPAEAGPRLNWMTDYNYAMSQIAHELGHRWAADAYARLANGDSIDLGSVHWAGNVHLAAAFPYGQPDGSNQEADLMGGSYWKDNGDGTFTQMNRDFYSPAKGYAWMPLYLMGLAKPDEVPPFFVLLNDQGKGAPLERVGQDAAGHPIVKARKQVVTIQDVIRAMGPRTPDFDHAEKHFNTAIVIMTRPGEAPPPFLIQSANNIAQHWSAMWSKVTGGRSTMTTDPHPTN